VQALSAGWHISYLYRSSVHTSVSMVGINAATTLFSLSASPGEEVGNDGA